MRRREYGKGTLVEGKEHGRVYCLEVVITTSTLFRSYCLEVGVYDGNGELSREGGRRKKCGRELQAAGEEPYWEDSRLGKINHDEGTLRKGGEPSWVCDGDGK